MLELRVFSIFGRVRACFDLITNMEISSAAFYDVHACVSDSACPRCVGFHVGAFRSFVSIEDMCSEGVDTQYN